MGAAGSVTAKESENEAHGSPRGEGLEYKMEFRGANGQVISPWHDIPICPAEGAVNFVCEIPKMGRAKLECDTKTQGNPIVQDVNKQGGPRFYHGPIFWNYGYVPQTWEDPSDRDEDLGCNGDGDPLDVVEIGSGARKVGSVTAVRPLGVLAMIDDGEVDWKVIAVALDDPLASVLNDITDVDTHCPGVVSGIREWFRWYKTPDGKALNKFGFEERALDQAKAVAVLTHTHASWRALREGQCDAHGRWSGAGGAPTRTSTDRDFGSDAARDEALQRGSRDHLCVRDATPAQGKPLLDDLQNLIDEPAVPIGEEPTVVMA